MEDVENQDEMDPKTVQEAFDNIKISSNFLFYCFCFFDEKGKKLSFIKKRNMTEDERRKERKEMKEKKEMEEKRKQKIVVWLTKEKNSTLKNYWNN